MRRAVFTSIIALGIAMPAGAQDLSFDEDSSIQTTSKVTESSSSETPIKMVPGWRVTAYATPATEGNIMSAWNTFRFDWDMSNGIPQAIGQIGEWNDADGVQISAKTRLADHPMLINMLYATKAEAYLDIEKPGTYGFRIKDLKDDIVKHGKKPSFRQTALFVNGELLSGAQKEDEYGLLQLQPGRYPVELVFYNQSPDQPYAHLLGDEYTVSKIRTHDLKVEIRHFEQQEEFYPIEPMLVSEKVKEQPDNRISSPISGLDYTVAKPLNKNDTNPSVGFTPKKFDISFSAGDYSAFAEKGNSEAGIIKGVPAKHLVEYLFIYDAKTSGTHWVLPLARKKHIFFTKEETGEDLSYVTVDQRRANRLHKKQDAQKNLMLRDGNVCQHTMTAYDPSVSQHTPIMSGHDGSGVSYIANAIQTSTGTADSDQLGHINVAEAREIEIKGKMVCYYPFDLTILTKGPKDVRFRTFTDDQQRPNVSLFE